MTEQIFTPSLYIMVLSESIVTGHEQTLRESRSHRHEVCRVPVVAKAVLQLHAAVEAAQAGGFEAGRHAQCIGSCTLGGARMLSCRRLYCGYCGADWLCCAIRGFLQPLELSLHVWREYIGDTIGD